MRVRHEMAGAAASSITRVSMPGDARVGRATARPLARPDRHLRPAVLDLCGSWSSFSNVSADCKPSENGRSGGPVRRDPRRRHVRRPYLASSRWSPAASAVIGQPHHSCTVSSRRCVAHIELRQLPCAQPQLDPLDIGMRRAVTIIRPRPLRRWRSIRDGPNRCRHRAPPPPPPSPAPELAGRFQPSPAPLEY